MNTSAQPDALEPAGMIQSRVAERASRTDLYFKPDPWIAGLVGCVEELLEKVVASDIPLMETIGRHMLFGYAKRLRPTFVLLAQQLYRETVMESAVDCAAAAELIHCASLFHDDVIDSAKTRKGRRAANAVWGNKSAVIMGDHFFVLAYTLLAKQRDFRLMNIFIETCRSLSGGIMDEIRNTGNLEIDENTHSAIIEGKTADFFRNCCITGGYLAGAEEEDLENLAGFGLNFGLAFQHSDDLLDLFADQAATGKPRGSDLRAGIFTTSVIRALSSSPEFAETYRPILADGKLTSGRIEEIADALRRNGAFDYTRGLVDSYCERSLGYLEKLPGGRACEAFRAMVTLICERKY